MSLLLSSVNSRRTPIPYPMPSAPPFNAPFKSPLPTPDGTGSALHFSAIDFGDNWFNGYRYWLGFTPYYNINDQIEDPCLACSHDGYHWRVPEGLTNPVFPTPPGLDYNSDIDIEFDTTTGLMHMWWREASPAAVIAAGEGRIALMHSTSPDGVHWAPKQLAIEKTNMSLAEVLISPSVVKVSDTEWHMHTGERDWSGGGGYLCRRTAPSADGPWSAPVSWKSGGSAKPRAPWHLEVMRDSGGVYRALIAEGTGGPLYPASSLDGLTWVSGENVIEGRDGHWDRALYRGGITEHEDGEHFRIWYAGRQSQWHLGFTQVPRSAWPVV